MKSRALIRRGYHSNDKNETSNELSNHLEGGRVMCRYGTRCLALIKHGVCCNMHVNADTDKLKSYTAESREILFAAEKKNTIASKKKKYRKKN